MASFVNITYPTQHTGVNRIESVIDLVQRLQRAFSGTRGLATLLLSAMVAAIMVVADQVMESVTEGHLLVMWMALWAVAFAALALGAGTARKLATRGTKGFRGWATRLAAARADRRVWAIAKTDSRVMADVQAACLRDEASAESALPQRAAMSGKRAERTVQLGAAVLRSYQRDYL